MPDAGALTGLLVIDDIVAIHGGELIYSTDPGYGPVRTYPPPFGLNATNPSRGALSCGRFRKKLGQRPATLRPYELKFRTSTT